MEKGEEKDFKVLEGMVSCPRCSGTGMIKLRKKRSLNQNAYYWLVLTMMALEMGDNKDDLHDDMREKYLSVKKVLPDNSVSVRKRSTTECDSKEFTDYLNSVKKWAYDYLNMVIPEPTQLTNDFIHDLEHRYGAMLNQM